MLKVCLIWLIFWVYVCFFSKYLVLYTKGWAPRKRGDVRNTWVVVIENFDGGVEESEEMYMKKKGEEIFKFLLVHMCNVENSLTGNGIE